MIMHCVMNIDGLLSICQQMGGEMTQKRKQDTFAWNLAAWAKFVAKACVVKVILAIFFGNVLGVKIMVIGGRDATWSRAQ